MLELPAERLEATVAAFNAAVRPGTFNHAVLDDCRTEGLAPPKTHWAQRIDTPPFWGYPLRPGHHVHLSRPAGSTSPRAS